MVEIFLSEPKMGGKFDSENAWSHIKSAQILAKKKNLHIILKGPTTIYVNFKGNCTVLPRGNPGLATAGSGDVLSGVLSAFLCQCPPHQAAELAVTLHSMAARAVAAKKSTRGMIASDIIKYIPHSICCLKSST